MISLFAAVFGIAAAPATGCVQKNASHCANLDGHATCASRGGPPLCSKCTSVNDGCVGTVEPECAIGVGSATTSVDPGTSTTESDTTTGSMSLTTLDPSMTTMSQTSNTEDSGTLPQLDGLPFCGDGVVNNIDEYCDGEDFGGLTCEGLGAVGGSLQCTEDCQIETDMCEEMPPCGDGEIAGDEECDGDMLDGATCKSVAGQAWVGELACNPIVCQYDTTACCLPEGALCLLNADRCCPGLKCTLGLLGCSPVE